MSRAGASPMPHRALAHDAPRQPNRGADSEPRLPRLLQQTRASGRTSPAQGSVEGTTWGFLPRHAAPPGQVGSWNYRPVPRQQKVTASSPALVRALSPDRGQGEPR